MPESFSQYERERQLRKTLTVRNITITVILTMLLFCIKAMLDGIWLRVFIALLIIFSCALVLNLLRAARMRAAVQLLLATVWFASAQAVVTNGGGILNAAVGWFIIHICLAGLLCSLSCFKFWGGFSLLTVVAVFICEIFGIEMLNFLPEKSHRTQAVVTVFMQFVGILALIYLFLRQFSRYDTTIKQQVDHLQTQVVQVEQAEAEARASERARQQFMENMSHEMRTPLNSIIGFSGLLLKRAGEEDKRLLQAVESIYRNGLSMLAFVNELIELGSIEDERENSQTQFSLDNLVRTNCEVLSVKANDYALGFSYENLMACETIGNIQEIQRAITNLICFSIRQTDKGLIVVDLSAEDSEAKLVISDTGPGYSSEQLEGIFEPHYDFILNTEKQLGVSALSLVIAKKILDKHTWSVTVSSELGAGTQFSILIPICR